MSSAAQPLPAQIPAQIPVQIEDALTDLPGSVIKKYRKGQIVYRQDLRSTSIYLVVDGTVKVSRLADARRQAIIDIYQPGEFFGESAILDLDPCTEQATALEDVGLKAWAASTLDEIVTRNPRLGIALSRMLVQRIIHFNERIETFATDSIPRRLARALVRFSDRMGKPQGHGWTDMPPFTHGLLGQYIGTDREIVTVCMSEFRRQGYLRYSRAFLTVHQECLREFLRQNASSRRGKTRPPAPEPLRVRSTQSDRGASAVAAQF